MIKKELLIIFLLALILRSLFLFYPYETADSHEYRNFALNMLKHHTFAYSLEPPLIPSVYRAPVYPAFIALIYSVFGMKDIFVYIAQVIISILTCLVVYFIALQLFNRRVAFGSGIAVALHPFLSWYVGSLMTETLFTFLLAATVLLLLKAISFKSHRLFFISGIMLAITALCRATTQFLFLFIAIALLFIFNKKEPVFKYITIFFTGFIICILPWTLRNYIVTKQFIPIVSEGPSSLYYATLDSQIYDDAKQSSCYLGGQRDALLKRHLSDVRNDQLHRQLNKELWKQAIANIKKNPVAFLFKRARCQFYLWAGSNYMINTTYSEALSRHDYGIIIIKTIITLIFHILPIAMYLCAGWLLRKEWRKYILVYSIPIYFAILHFPIHIEMRYSIPAYPYILIFCVYTFLYLVGNEKYKKANKTTTPIFRNHSKGA